MNPCQQCDAQRQYYDRHPELAVRQISLSKREDFNRSPHYIAPVSAFLVKNGKDCTIGTRDWFRSRA